MPFQYQIQVGNSGTGSAENVVVTAEFDTGLEHESKKNLLQLPVGTVPAGARDGGEHIPVQRQPYYEGQYGRQGLPGATAFYDRCLSLPLFPAMQDGDVERVVEALRDVIG